MENWKKLTAAAAGLAGAGAAVALARRKTGGREACALDEYRNTERGRQEKNAKGIYYSSGNYEAFARPEKPEGVDQKHAYLVGSGMSRFT